MAQRYTHPTALERMDSGLCPECGEAEEQHLNDPRFWMPRRCDLLPRGVRERIEQRRSDRADR